MIERLDGVTLESLLPPRGDLTYFLDSPGGLGGWAPRKGRPRFKTPSLASIFRSREGFMVESSGPPRPESGEERRRSYSGASPPG